MENTTTPLTAREVCQVLRELALGTRVLHGAADLGPGQMNTGQMLIEVDGWILTLVRDSEGLRYCQACQAPDGRLGTVNDWQRYGTDPVQLLSTWEHQRVQGLLAGL